jgi:hypothetical protein
VQAFGRNEADGCRGKKKKTVRRFWNNGKVLFGERKMTSKDNRPAVQAGEVEKHN